MKINELSENKFILINDIIPDDEIKRRKPFFYPKGTIIEITPNGVYIPHA